MIFYHTVDAGGKTYEGPWDLRGREGDYLGGASFSGQRVIDVGVASGGLAFYIEGHGGAVTGYDLSDRDDWDLVPFYGGSCGPALSRKARRDHIKQINAGLEHLISARGSGIEVRHGSVYDIHKTHSKYDISVIGALLLHLRDPFLAMHRTGMVTYNKMIVTLGAEPWRWHLRRLPPVFPATQRLLPDPRTKTPDDTWWRISPEWVIRSMGILGFPNTKLTWHRQMAYGKMRRMFTVVGERRW